MISPDYQIQHRSTEESSSSNHAKKKLKKKKERAVKSFVNAVIDSTLARTQEDMKNYNHEGESANIVATSTIDEIMGLCNKQIEKKLRKLLKS
jgi:hypothetical protein